MKLSKLVSGLMLVAVLGLVISVAVPAQESGSSSSGSVSVGGQSVTGNSSSSKFQEFQDIPNGLLIFDANFFWNNHDNYYFNFNGTDFGTDSQSGTLVWGQWNNWKLTLTWNQNPRWFSNTGSTLYVSPSTGIFTIPYAIRNSIQNGGMTLADYVSGAHPVSLRYLRETGTADFSYYGLPNWTFNANYSLEKRHGTMPLDFATYFSNGPNIYELPVPVQYKTQNYHASAEFHNKIFFASAAFYGSRFDNGASYLQWDNPNRVTDGVGGFGPAALNSAAVFATSIYPDNTMYHWDLAGGVNLPYHNRITASLSWGQMKQDSPMMPYTTNSAILATLPDPTVPYSSVNAKIDTFLGNFKLTGQPIKWFGYSVKYRKYKDDNKTPYYVFPNWVAGDTMPETTAFGTMAVGYEKTTWGGEVHFQPINPVRFAIAYTHDKWDQQFRDFTDTTQKTWKLNLDLNYNWVTFHGSYADITYRDGGENLLLAAYHTPGQPAEYDPGTTQFDIWSRDTKQYNGVVTFIPVENFDITLSAQQNKNDYPDSVYGLTYSKYNNYGIELDYAFNEKVTAYASYMYEKYNYDMETNDRPAPGTYYPAVNNWGNNTEDKYDTYTAGLSWTVVPNVFDIRSDFSYAKARSNSTFVWTAASAANADLADYPFYPEDFTKTTIWKTRFTYHINKSLSASAEYWWQKYEGADWATDIMNVYMGGVDPSAANSMFLGAQVPDYGANIFRFMLTYKF